MVVGTLFTANLNADKICLDMTYLPDPIKNKFWLTIKNQSLLTLYFKIICNITNWSVDTPAAGKLGAIGGGGTTTFTPVLARSRPATEATDSGNLKLEAYTDSAYTNKVAEDTLAVTAYIEDLENWTDVAKSDFDDGTAMGWTLTPAGYMSISDDLSVEVGGYSAKYERMGTFTEKVSISKSMSIPNRAKVRVAFFFAYYLYSASSSYFARISKPLVEVDSEKVFDVPLEIDAHAMGSKVVGWLKITADLSAYKNTTKTVTLSFEAKGEREQYSTRVKIWFDRVVVAGED